LGQVFQHRQAQAFGFFFRQRLADHGPQLREESLQPGKVF
jgi:hypothetical protein